MDIDKLLVKIDSLKKLQDDIAYEITQVVSKANVISEILYSISYEDNAPIDVSEFLLDNEIYTLDNFDLESHINWESYEDDRTSDNRNRILSFASRIADRLP